MRRWIPTLVLMTLLACKGSKEPASPTNETRTNETPTNDATTSGDCHEGAGDSVGTAARTGLEGAKTGIFTAGAGIKQAGRAGAGLVEGGTDGAREQWNDGKRETKQTAHDGAAETKKAAGERRCR